MPKTIKFTLFDYACMYTPSQVIRWLQKQIEEGNRVHDTLVILDSMVYTSYVYYNDNNDDRALKACKYMHMLFTSTDD